MVCHLKNQKLYGGLKHENQDKQNKQKISVYGMGRTCVGVLVLLKE